MSRNVVAGPHTSTRRGPHRAWWVVAGAFCAIVAAGAFSTMAGLLVDPITAEFGWSRGAIGVATAINMVLYGLTAPFAAAMMDRLGMRRVVTGALAVLAVGAVLTTTMTQVWQFTVYWGLLIGMGTGSLALTFAATVTGRWFARRQGLAVGILTSASVLGQFLFLPVLGWIVVTSGWRPSLATLVVAAAVAAPLVHLLLRDHPADVGTAPYGAAEPVAAPKPVRAAARRTVHVLGRAARTWPFWLLATTFAICGASTNGVMWTHFVPAAHAHGMTVPVAASMLTLVGLFTVVGTVGSGWLTDRLDPRLLLTGYYVLRGASLLVLPGLFGPHPGPGLIGFAIFFGVLDLATVPPTITLCREIHGAAGAIVFGWVNAAHQIGAAAVAVLGGVIHDETGTYDPMWFLAGGLCFAAAGLAPLISRRRAASASR